MDRGDFGELVIERYAVPRKLSDDEFRAWMHTQRIFISSLMDEEMTADRQAIRACIRAWGGTPVMWEEIVPKDERSQRAYLDGVDRSNLFVLALGTRYGTGDAGGGSPTFHENERAVELSVPRLVFKRSNVNNNDRDKRLVDWINTMYNELSISNYANHEELTTALERSLREIAAAQETKWIKLGSAVFPGQTRYEFTLAGREITIDARIIDRNVLEYLSSLIDPWGRRGNILLTFDDRTLAAVDLQITIAGETRTSSTVQIRSREDAQRRQIGGFGIGSVTHNGRARTYTPADQAELWASIALFRGNPPERAELGLGLFIEPDGPTLDAVLRATGARGWVAEGLTRVYVIEGLTKKFGGRFQRLEVGPATASGIRIAAEFQPDAVAGSIAQIRGIVPIPD